MLRNLKKQKPECSKGDDLMLLDQLQKHCNLCTGNEMDRDGNNRKERLDHFFTAVINRDGWQKLLRKALAQSGLLCQ